MFLMLVSEAVHFAEHLKPKFRDWKYRINLDLLSGKQKGKADLFSC